MSLALKKTLFIILTFAFFADSTLCLAEINVGLSLVDITPPVGGFITGYRSTKPTEGVHDPITARVMILQSENTCIAMVTCDLCVYSSPYLHQQMASIGVDRLLLMNTHTHAGPDLTQKASSTEDKPWEYTVDARLLEAIKQAKQHMFKAFFTASESQIQLGYNRLVQRGKFAVTHFENPERIPYGPVDQQVGVIRVTDEQQKVRAVIVNYACHSVVLGPQNRQLSADYPGVMREIVEAEFGSDCMCIFIQGAAGDINPLILARGNTRENDFNFVRKQGELLAIEVKRALNLIKDTQGVSDSVSIASKESQFHDRWKPDEQFTLGVTTLLINDNIGILTMPGEPFHQFQTEFRNKAGLKHAYLFGYCCDGPYKWPSYLPDIESAARGGYGASEKTEVEVGAGERLLTDGLIQLYTLQGRLKKKPRLHTFDKNPE